MTQRFDEMHNTAGAPRPHYRVFDEWLRNTSAPVIDKATTSRYIRMCRK